VDEAVALALASQYPQQVVAYVYIAYPQLAQFPVPDSGIREQGYNGFFSAILAGIDKPRYLRFGQNVLNDCFWFPRPAKFKVLAPPFEVPFYR